VTRPEDDPTAYAPEQWPTRCDHCGVAVPEDAARQVRHERLYDEWHARARKAVREIAAEPAYAEIARDEATYEPIAGRTDGNDHSEA